jgi:hypothetical protein
MVFSLFSSLFPFVGRTQTAANNSTIPTASQLPQSLLPSRPKDSINPLTRMSNAVERANHSPTEIVKEGFEAFYNLYQAVKEQLGDKILLSVAIDKTLNFITKFNNCELLDAQLYTPGLGPIETRKLQEIKSKITEIQGELEGYKSALSDDTSTTHALTSKRNLIKEFIANESTIKSMIMSQDTDAADLLGTFYNLKRRQQGIIDASIEHTLVRVDDYVTTRIRDLTSSATSSSNLVDLDQYTPNEAVTTTSVIQSIINFCKAPGYTTSLPIFKSALVSVLTSAKEKLSANTELLSQTAGTAHPIIQSLEKSIEILNNPDITDALTAVQTELSKHTLYIGNLTNLGLPVKKYEAITHVSQIRDQLTLESPIQDNVITPNYSRDITTLAGEVSEIGALQATFQAIFGYLIKGSFKAPPVFQQIYTNAATSDNPKKTILNQFNKFIRENKDLNIFVRYLLPLFTPLIFKVSTHCITKFKEGFVQAANSFIESTQNKQNSSTDVYLEPIYQFNDAIQSLSEAHKRRVRSRKANPSEAKKELNKDASFLETEENGCRSLKQIYNKAGDLAVKRFLVPVRPTSFLRNLNRSILNAIEELDNKALNLTLYFTTLPFRFTLKLLNSIFVLPIEWVSNKITYNLVRFILRKTEGVETAVNMLEESLFPKKGEFREPRKAIDTMIITLLKKLQTKLDAPSRKSDSEPKKLSNEAQEALAEAVEAALDLIGVKNIHTHEKLQDYEKRPHASGGLGHSLNQVAKGLLGNEANLDKLLAESIKEILASAYTVLFDKETLQQQIVFGLESLKSGMTTAPAKEEPSAATSEETSESDQSAYIDSLRSSVIEKTAHLLHKPLTTGGEKDVKLKEHHEILKELIDSKIAEIHTSLESDENNYSALYKTLDAFLKEIETTLLALNTLERNGHIGKDAHQKYVATLEPTISDLKEFSLKLLAEFNKKALQETLAIANFQESFDNLCKKIDEILNQTEEPTNLEALRTESVALYGNLEDALAGKDIPHKLKKFMSQVKAFNEDSRITNAAKELYQIDELTKWLDNPALEKKFKITNHGLNQLVEAFSKATQSKKVSLRAQIDQKKDTLRGILYSKARSAIDERSSQINVAARQGLLEVAATEANPDFKKLLEDIRTKSEEIKLPDYATIPLDTIVPFYNFGTQKLITLIETRIKEMEDALFREKESLMAIIQKCFIIPFVKDQKE